MRIMSDGEELGPLIWLRSHCLSFLKSRKRVLIGVPLLKEPTSEITIQCAVAPASDQLHKFDVIDTPPLLYKWFVPNIHSSSSNLLYVSGMF